MNQTNGPGFGSGIYQTVPQHGSESSSKSYPTMSWEEAEVTNGIILVNGMTNSMQKLTLTLFSLPTRDHWAESLIEEGLRLRITLQNVDTKQRITISATTILKRDVTPYQIDDADSFEHIAEDQILVKTENKSTTNTAHEPVSTRQSPSTTPTVQEQKDSESTGENQAQAVGGDGTTALLQNILDQMAQLKAQVQQNETNNQKTSKKINYNEAETWQVDEFMKCVQSRLSFRFKITATGKPEHPEVHNLRLHMWNLMKTSLGKFAKNMTYNIPHGDVRALLTRVMNMSRQNSVITARGIHLKVRTHFKTNQLAFGSWHQQLQDWYDTLTSLRQPVPFNEQVINYITLITDVRYKDEVRKVEKHGGIWDEAQILSCLRARALKLDDMHNKYGQQSSTNNTSTDNAPDDSGGNNQQSGRKNRSNKKTTKGQNGQDKDKPSKYKGLCSDFLSGKTCPFGERCFYQHISLEEMVLAKKKAQGDNSNANNSQQRLSTEEERKQSPEGKIPAPCHEYMKSNSCPLGDSCAQLHPDDATQQRLKIGQYSESKYANTGRNTQMRSAHMVQRHTADPLSPRYDHPHSLRHDYDGGFDIGETIRIEGPTTGPLYGLTATILSLTEGDGPKATYALRLHGECVDKDARKAAEVTGCIPHHWLTTTRCPTLPDETTSTANATRHSMATPYTFKAILDPGAQDSLCPYRELFEPGSITTLTDPVILSGYNGGDAEYIKERGLVRINSNMTDTKGEYILVSMFYAPNSKRILINQAELDDRGYWLEFGGGGARLRKEIDGPSILALPRAAQKGQHHLHKYTVTTALPARGPIQFSKHGKLRNKNPFYPVPDVLFPRAKHINAKGNTRNAVADICQVSIKADNVSPEELLLLHEHMGHIGIEQLARMVGWEKGVTIPASTIRKAYCASCAIASSSAIPALKEGQWFNADKILKHVSADIIDALPITRNGYRYFLVLIDWHSSAAFGWKLRRKSEATTTIIIWIKWAQAVHHPHKVGNLHFDGGESATNELKAFVETYCHGNTYTNAPSAHEHNSRAENLIKRIKKSRRACEQRGGGHIARLWEYALPDAIEANNLVPSIRELRKTRTTPKGAQKLRPLSPFEIWTGHTVCLGQLWRNRLPLFGEVICHVPREKRASNTAPSFYALYLGPTTPSLAPGHHMRAHRVMRYADGKMLTNVRHARWTGEYPLNDRGANTSLPGWMHQMRITAAADKYAVANLPSSLPPGGEDEKDQADINNNDADLITPQHTEVHDEEPKEPSPPELEPIPTYFADVNGTQQPSNSPNQWSTTTSALPQSYSALNNEPNENNSQNDEDTESHSDELERQTAIGSGTGKFPIGTRVMTPHGYGTVHQTFNDGEIEIRFDCNDLVETIQELDGDQLWLPEEYPHEVYDGNNNLIDPSPLTEANHITATQGPGQVSPYLEMVCTSLIYASHRPLPLCDGTTQPQLSSVNNSGRPPPLPGHRLEDLVGKVKADIVAEHLPRFHHQTYNSPLRPLIEDSEYSELRGIINANTLGEPREKTPEENRIALMWAYAAKPSDDGNGLFKKLKSRCAMRGDQERGTNALTRLQAYAPVQSAASFRVLAALHLHEIGPGPEDVKFKKVDVKQAYISTKMKRKVVVGHPPGYEIINTKLGLAIRKLQPGEKPPTTVMPLIMALYGGMECGRLFWDDFISYHLEIGFKKIPHEACYLQLKLDTPPKGIKGWIKFCFHVDDSQHAHKGDAIWVWYLDKLLQKYEITESDLTENLGIRYRIDYVNKVIRMDQSAFLEKVVRSFGMVDGKPALTPIHYGKQPTSSDAPDDPEALCQIMESFPMEKCMGCLLWAEQTLHGISLVTRILCSQTKRYGDLHIAWAKHALRYILGAMYTPLVFRAGFPLKLQLFADASHATVTSDGKSNGKSRGGVVGKLAGNTIFAKSVVLPIVAHNSAESELMALFKACKLGQYVRWLILEIGGFALDNIEIFVDNQAAIDFSHNPIQLGRNVHMHARFFYVRDLVTSTVYTVIKISTHDQIADVACSYKGQETFHKLNTRIMNCAIVEITNGVAAWNDTLINV